MRARGKVGLSPLLAKVLLDEVDKEVERRGNCFARYAAAANVYVRSEPDTDGWPSR